MTIIKFLKGWWEVIAFAVVLFLLHTFVVAPIVVDGHSMDPTLADKERMVMFKLAKINRFDIVVAQEPGEPDKNMIKRVIGLPGDTIEFNNDQLTINGKKYSEPYLDEYKKLWHEDKLQKTFSYSSFFQERAAEAKAFTISADKSPTFTVKVAKGHYFLMGDDRLISKDSREPSVGQVPASMIKGETKFSFWPLNNLHYYG
jgi:signal peptidase I